MRLRKGMAIVAVAAIALAACGDDDEEGADTTAAARDTTAPATTTTAATADTTAAATTTAPASDTTEAAPDTSAAGGAEGWQVDTADCPEEATQPIEGPIKIGVSLPQSGTPAVLFATLADGMNAYAAYINANGGINGQQVEVIAKDDQYSDAITASNTEELIDSDGIHLMAGTIGSPNNLAIQETMNEECIPQLYAATGALAWGDVENYPWTTGLLPTYDLESRVVAQQLESQFPDGAQVALFHVNNEFGQSYLNAFERVIEGTNIEIVSTETIEAGDTAAPTGQIANMQNSGANALLAVPLGAQCITFKNEMANAGWTPEFWYETATCANASLFYRSTGPNADGVHTGGWLKEVTNPEYADDDDVVLYTTELAKVNPDADPAAIAGVGWALMAGTQDILTRASESPDGLTRASIINAARSQDFVPPLAIDGVRFTLNGDEDAYLVESLQLQRWSVAADIFEPVGPVSSFEGEIEFVEE